MPIEQLPAVALQLPCPKGAKLCNHSILLLYCQKPVECISNMYSFDSQALSDNIG
ncbi:hypothetical protein SAMN02982985_04793 [Rugamonas rubra]|uniref:Uncharacterized protein n=1 Tax=Rugamonas rubra TaxID=758825 RepID=A0A1I4SIA0_9BURK|nr:hypothetical protein SAMN02982985_04793 [Rugamonas rubra]